MAATKCCILFISCLILVAAFPAQEQEAYLYEPEEAALYYDSETVLSRHARSSEDNGRLELRYQKDQFGQQSSATYDRDGQSGSAIYRDDKYGGRTVGGQYNQNLYKSQDGHLSYDAYAGGNHNLDNGRNDFHGGVKGTLSW